MESYKSKKHSRGQLRPYGNFTGKKLKIIVPKEKKEYRPESPPTPGSIHSDPNFTFPENYVPQFV